MNKFVLKSELGVQFFVAEGNSFNFKILSVHYKKQDAVEEKERISVKYSDE